MGRLLFWKRGRGGGLPTLMLKLVFSRSTPLWAKLLLALGVIYLLSPIDALPDAWPVGGTLDDLAVLAFSVTMFLLGARQDKVIEHLLGKPAGDDESRS